MSTPRTYEIQAFLTFASALDPGTDVAVVITTDRVVSHAVAMSLIHTLYPNNIITKITTKELQ